jgi:hypothetical protein
MIPSYMMITVAIYDELVLCAEIKNTNTKG